MRAFAGPDWGPRVSAQEDASSLHFTSAQIANRTDALFTHFEKGMYELLRSEQAGHVSAGLYQIAESFLNPLDLINAVVTDSGALVKSGQYRARRVSRRVQVCTGNLGAILDVSGHHRVPYGSALLPVYHIGVLVDQKEWFRDEGGGGLAKLQSVESADCSAVPILSDEPEAVAIEKILFIGNRYHPSYRLFQTNCAYFSRDVLSAAGFAYPIFANLGIGGEYPLTLDLARYRTVREEDLTTLRDLRTLGEIHLQRLRELFSDLEEGRVPALVESAIGSDALLQTLAAATRGENRVARKAVRKAYGESWANRLTGALGAEVARPSGIFAGIRREDLAWINDRVIMTAELYRVESAFLDTLETDQAARAHSP